MTSEKRDLNDQLKAKLEACTSPEELAAIADEEDIDLTDDMLEGMAGGEGWELCRMGGGLRQICYGYQNGNQWCERFGDSREGIEPSRVPAAFVNGALDASVFF